MTVPESYELPHLRRWRYAVNTDVITINISSSSIFKMDERTVTDKASCDIVRYRYRVTSYGPSLAEQHKVLGITVR